MVPWWGSSNNEWRKIKTFYLIYFRAPRLLFSDFVPEIALIRWNRPKYTWWFTENLKTIHMLIIFCIRLCNQYIKCVWWLHPEIVLIRWNRPRYQDGSLKTINMLIIFVLGYLTNIWRASGETISNKNLWILITMKNPNGKNDEYWVALSTQNRR